MPRVLRQNVVSFEAQQMFELVSDVERYPEFLPGCVDARVLHQDMKQQQAQLSLRKGGIQQSFTTINTLTPYSQIEMVLLEGPFKQLHGVWRFNNIAGGKSAVSLTLQFEFSNRMLAMVLGPMFHAVANSLVSAFSHQAKELFA